MNALVRRVRRLNLPMLRAAWWTWRSLRVTRRRLRESVLPEVVVDSPPRLPAHASAGVFAVLRRQPNTCLERALVLQKWLEAQGQDRDVVIGVTAAGKGFHAHAWLDGEPAPSSFRELTRLRGDASR